MKHRQLVFHGEYFKNYFDRQKPKIRDKIIWTMKIIQEQEQIPIDFFKHITGEKGLYEIRTEYSGTICRIFCFFDRDNSIVLINGFTKKTQKTPRVEIERALKIKNAYEYDK
ncbi:type II toxin-antitoxin system RelE/ParE family toxin [Aquirufa antheringensis]|jgi:phage-related protein|uniref:type II toxin-antitoxin system RelE/ParE family toxin n=1 Tax=Aquirufa antheringensis TaxID=2516559 RepID=UPI003BB224F6